MKSEEVLQNELDKVENLLSKIGAEKSEEFEEELEDGTIARGFTVTHFNHQVQIYGAYEDHSEYLIVLYPFDVIETLAQQLKAEEQGGLDDFIPDQDKEYITKAEDQLSDIDGGNWVEIKQGLFERLVSENAYFAADEGEKIPLKSFEIQSKIFPKLDNFDVSDLEKAINTVISKGLDGRLWLIHALGRKEEVFLEEDFEGEKFDRDLGYIG